MQTIITQDVPLPISRRSVLVGDALTVCFYVIIRRAFSLKYFEQTSIGLGPLHFDPVQSSGFVKNVIFLTNIASVADGHFDPDPASTFLSSADTRDGAKGATKYSAPGRETWTFNLEYCSASLAA